MENNAKILFTQDIHINIASEDIERFYLTMALMMFPDLRKPEYKKKTLLKHLYNYYKKDATKFHQHYLEDSQNLIKFQIWTEKQNHYQMIKKLALKYRCI